MTVQKLLVFPHAANDGCNLLSCCCCCFFVVFCFSGKGFKSTDKRTALSLHTASLNVQDIYSTLNEEGGSNMYQNAKATLNKYFKPQYEGFCLRETSK